MILSMLAAATIQSRLNLSEVSAERLRGTVEKLASYPTRNTNTPELTQAAEWIAGEYRKIPGMQVELMTYPLHKGKRVPEDKDAVQVIATLPGEDATKVIVGGHFDTINLKGDVYNGRAPGANDDASGVAMALECARLLAPMKHRHTLVFVAFSGEEQALLGSKAPPRGRKSKAGTLRRC